MNLRLSPLLVCLLFGLTQGFLFPGMGGLMGGGCGGGCGGCGGGGGCGGCGGGCGCCSCCSAPPIMAPPPPPPPPPVPVHCPIPMGGGCASNYISPYSSYTYGKKK